MGKTNEVFSLLHYEKVHRKPERMNANTRFPGRIFFVDVGNLQNDVIDIFAGEIVTEYKPVFKRAISWVFTPLLQL